MAFQSVPNTAGIVIRGVLNGVTITNTFYARRDAGYTLADLTDLAGAVDDWWNANALPLLSSSYTYSLTEVTGLENENDFQAQSAIGAGAGGRAVEPLSNALAMAFKRSSGLTGRTARGRVYIGGMDVNELSSDENQVNVAYLNSWRDVLDLLRTIIEVLGWVEVIVSRYVNGAKRATAVTFDVAGYTYTDAFLDTQRGRRPTGA